MRLTGLKEDKKAVDENGMVIVSRGGFGEVQQWRRAGDLKRK